jgi:dihydroorotate dehydrogenase
VGLNLYKPVAKQALFALPPERAQKAAEWALRQGILWRPGRAGDARLATDLCGMKLANPVGLAAGFDKDCRMVRSLSRLGFGYLVVGTVVSQPQPGNPKPRLLRLKSEGALVNALGFPSKGLEHAAAMLEGVQDVRTKTPVLASLSGVQVEVVVRCHERLEPLVDAVEVNISSPNTAGLRVFQQAEELARLLRALNDGRMRPLFVKLPRQGEGESTAEGDARLVALTRVCVREGVEGVTVGNSRPVKDARLAVGAGGLSGRPLLEETLRMVAAVRAEAGGKLVVNACGGITTGEDAWRALRAGATTVQLYTAMVYEGPGVVRSITRGLVRRMER